MLDRQKVIVALEEKLDQFNGFSADFAQQIRLLEARLAAFRELNAAQIEQRLVQMDVLWSGARPTPELDQAQALCLPFAPRWNNHAEARAWARDILTAQAVIAVDGSQIAPTKDFSVPVGAIQIGWFVNAHQNGHYIKDVAFEVFAPADLALEEEAENAGAEQLSDWRVSQARFVRECEKLCELMASAAQDATRKKPICLFDGSYIVSFAGQMRPGRAEPYLRAVQELLACSEEYAVPLVGYVDTSYSHDFVTLLDLMSGQDKPLTLGDAALFSRVLTNWGERSPAFICARDDGLTRENRAGFYQDVVFTYLRTTGNRPPARLELPRWVLETGDMERVLDVVRAECVVGGGYPYAIETVDALAVISQQDRQRFYALFEQFAARVNLGLTQARKAASKQVRR